MSPRKDQKKNRGEKQPTAEEGLPQAAAVQQPLFGEADLVLNTLEIEMTEVRKDLERCAKARERLDAREQELETRETNLREAIVATRKTLKAMAE